ncbi:MAG: 16S rRNA (guanine(966)-N(2))-methyltransferase RsmD [Alphaproteobacteria bacterium]|nr:16S rRNA (guanine(966)-N(2))-methyltransferase RsmD [Alphaproteobacteria bacterium]
MTGKVRITAGTFKNKPLAVPEGDSVRPTSDRARQALFNRLEHSFSDIGFRLRGARVVDLFAGTGALGLEALSRGASPATFIERSPTSLAVLKRNIAALGVDDKVTVLTMDATTLPAASQPYNLALLDPPYEQSLAEPALVALASKQWLTDAAVVAVETAAAETLAAPDGLTIEDVRSYGRGAITYLTADQQKT